MALLDMRGVHLGYGGPPLLDGIDLQIEPKERLCLVGRNGTGKSTLMRLICAELRPDDGEIVVQQGLRITLLAQEVPEGLSGTVFDVVAAGLGRVGELLCSYHEVSHHLAQRGGERLLAELEHIQHALETADGWQIHQQVETVLSRLELDPDAEFTTLSGGIKRRVLLARALVRAPDLLLLDEPTNHLDIESIAWLEEFLLGYPATLLFVTHDRMFLRRLATRIIELDRGRLTSWPGDYDTYLKRKQAAFEAETAQQILFDKKLAQEEQWIRQGIQARRTRNQGRVRALQALRETRRARRAHGGQARMHMQQAERSGRLVIEAQGVSYRYQDRPLIHNLSTTILRGDKVGIIGRNGSGKTTLLRILLGDLQPDEGSVRLGTGREVAYFDQLRSQLQPDKSVIDNVAEGREHVVINGKARHVISYLQDFLFAPARARTPVQALSGGERNRLLLARLFSKPSNILVLDEPTNDLDIETLELLEDLLIEYSGTLLLVSHDRAFLNNVVTSTLAFADTGEVGEFVGGYDDWLRQRPVAVAKPTTKAPPRAPVRTKPERPRKLGYKDQRELEALPRQIEDLEKEREELQLSMGDPAFYQQDTTSIATANARLENLERKLDAAYARWETLEALRD